MRILAMMLALTFGLSGMASADPYRLIAGDTLGVAYSGLAVPISVDVDPDGEIRLPDLGGIPVAGLTLDEAEAQLAEAMTAQQLYVEPRVSVSVTEYAAVVVSGDVMQPGRVPFIPGMTAAAAMALAGGTQVAGLTRNEIARARTEAETGLQTANLDIAWASVRLARFRAAQSGGDLDIKTSGLLAGIPNPALAGIDVLIETENNILETQRQRTRELEAFWEQEIETILGQLALFDDRIAVQQGIVESTAEALAQSRELSERGLQTNARFQVAEQRDADARARMLELETAKIAAARAISDAQRARAQYLAQQTQDAQAGENEVLLTLQAARLRHEKFAAQTMLLGGQALGSEAVVLNFAISSSREGRSGMAVSADMPILPGDLLIVEVSADPEFDG